MMVVYYVGVMKLHVPAKSRPQEHYNRSLWSAMKGGLSQSLWGLVIHSRYNHGGVSSVDVVYAVGESRDLSLDASFRSASLSVKLTPAFCHALISYRA